jgi:hypothetical protein
MDCKRQRLLKDKTDLTANLSNGVELMKQIKGKIM